MEQRPDNRTTKRSHKQVDPELSDKSDIQKKKQKLEMDPGSSGTSNIPEKEQKPENRPTKRSHKKVDPELSGTSNNPKKGQKLEIDSDSSVTSNIPEKEQKSENVLTKKSHKEVDWELSNVSDNAKKEQHKRRMTAKRSHAETDSDSICAEKEQKPEKIMIKNNMPGPRQGEQVNVGSEYSGYRCACGRKLTWEDLEDDDIIQGKGKKQLEELYDKYLLSGSVWIYGVKVTIPISCPKCDDETEINFEVDADIMWEEDVPDHLVPNIEDYDITNYRILPPDGEYPGYDSLYFGYQCSCGWELDDKDLEDNNGIRRKLEEQLDYMEDDKHLMIDMESVYDVIVTVPITCPKCDHEIDINFKVNAGIMWEKDAPDHRLPNIEGYRVFQYRVFPAFVPIGFRDVMAAAYFSYEDLDDPYVDITDDALEEPKEIELDIICKTTMNGGRCVVGLDQGNRLRRPIYNTAKDSCCWPVDKNFKVWNRCKFNVLRHPDAVTEPPTPFPHSNEDTVVEKTLRTWQVQIGQVCSIVC